MNGKRNETGNGRDTSSGADAPSSLVGEALRRPSGKAFEGTTSDPISAREQTEALRGELKELGEVTRRACAGIIRLIDEGKFGELTAEAQLAWLYTLKNRRENIVGALKLVDGTRADRVGLTARTEGDKGMRNEE